MAIQNDMEHILDLLDRNEITLYRANIMMIQVEGFRLIKSSIPRSTRKSLNAAVKNCEIGHLKKEGNKPEAYFKLNCRSSAIEARNNHERSVSNAMNAIFR